MKKLPTLSIIIPAWNEEEIIVRCLRGALEQTMAADEIIIVDNNSTDGTTRLVKKMIEENPKGNIRLVSEKTQGMIPARNKGFAVAKSEILGRIDADSIIDKNWVAEVKKTFLDAEICGTTGPVVYHDMPFKKIGKTSDDLIRRFINAIAYKYTFLFGSNMAIRKTAWKKIEKLTSLDPNNEIHEDVDISLCLSEVNCKTKYNPKMIGSMSARRIEDNPREFAHYMARFKKTYKLHEKLNLAGRIPPIIFWSIYFPIKAMRKINKLLE